MIDDTIRHHALAPEHLDAPHRRVSIGDVALESGATLHDAEISWVEHGITDRDGTHTILGCTAIGATHHRLDFLIGPGRALDTSRYRIIVIDALGNGLSTSPSNANSGQRGPDFPRLAMRDMVATQYRLATQFLGLSRIHAVIGASMGGMQALQWGVSFPDFMKRIVALTPMARTAPWARTLNEAARRALMGDPDFAGGRYTRQPERGWRDWAVIMRGLASRTPAALAAMPDHQAWLRAAQDTVLDTGLDANDYIAQSHAYDAHDVGTTPGFSGDTDAALRAVRAAALIAAPTLDLYNPAECARDAAAKIPGARLVELPTIMGHHAASAADPASVALLDREIGKFLD